MRAKDALGRYGEQVAARHLEDAGWVVLARNWRSPDRQVPGELDIVAMDGATLVVVEVKTRRHAGRGSAIEAVTPRKLVRVRRLTGVWLASARSADAPAVGAVRGVRVDVIAVHVPPSGPAGLVHLRGVD